MTSRRFPLALLPLILLLSPGSASARTYTLSEAVGDALRQSDAVVVAEAKTDMERAKADEALLMFFPRVGLTGGWAHLDSVPYVEQTVDFAEWLPADLTENPLFGDMFADMEPVTLQLEFGRQDMFQFQLQAEQILFAGTGLHRQRAMAMAQLRSAREEERTTEHEVVHQAEELFWKLALARQARQVTEEAIETAGTHVELLEAFVEVGLASDADLMAARVQLASLRLNALQARQGVDLAEAAFRMVVHVPDGESIELDVEGGHLPLGVDVEARALTELARDSRPEMRVLGEQMTSVRHAAGASWASWLPALALQGNVHLKNPDRANEPNFYWSADITVGMQWQLWDRGAALSRNRQAKAGMRQIEAYRRQLRDGIKLEIDIALAAYREADEQRVVAGEVVGLAEESLRLAKLNFGEGVARNVDVLEAQTVLSKARLDSLSAETNYRIAVAGLRKATGLDVEGI
ncbi:MAG: TolC family protein [Myxococcota bacterium]|jgi:outer membrane protein TolC|nr:TolC family protein [Myxococcota bacterium]